MGIKTRKINIKPIQDIDTELISAGYQMLGDNKIENLILSILKTKNERYLKALPFLIYLHSPDISFIKIKTKQKALFHEIIKITIKIFNDSKLYKKASKLNSNLENNPIKNSNNKIKLNYNDFLNEFILQHNKANGPDLIIDKEKIHSERSTQMNLSIIFTNKEKEIIQKILNESPINKTESEYYSRKTKKKLFAITSLQNLAKTMLSISPKKIK